MRHPEIKCPGNYEPEKTVDVRSQSALRFDCDVSIQPRVSCSNSARTALRREHSLDWTAKPKNSVPQRGLVLNSLQSAVGRFCNCLGGWRSRVLGKECPIGAVDSRNDLGNPIRSCRSIRNLGTILLHGLEKETHLLCCD